MPSRKSLVREEKLQNLMANHSMIFMGMFEESFAEIAERMTEAVSAEARAMAGGLGRPSAERVDKNLKGLTPEIRAHIGLLFSDIREEIALQWPKNPELFRRYISSPAFDQGIAIVERYDLGRPRLTEALSDEVLASYVFLLKGGDPKATKMFKELSEWQGGLPKPPWAV
jgi:hypothetical protein